MKRKNGIIIALSVLLVIVFSAGLLSFFSVGFSNWDYKTWFDRFSAEEEGIQVIEEAPSMLSYAFEVVPEMDLKLGTAGVNVGGYSTHTINATVLPSTAIDKYVTWSVEWVTPDSAFASGKTVTDYLTVVPTVAGSSEALLTCLQSFRGDQIKVNATSRAGGFTSSCLVNFIGIPTSYEIVSVGDYDTVNGAYVFMPGNTYTFEIVFDNIYDDVCPNVSGYNIIPNRCKTDFFAGPVIRYGPDSWPSDEYLDNFLDDPLEATPYDVDEFLYIFFNTWGLVYSDLGNYQFSIEVPSTIFSKTFDYGINDDCRLSPKVTGTTLNNSLLPFGLKINKSALNSSGHSSDINFSASGYTFSVINSSLDNPVSDRDLEFFFATDVTGLTLDEEEIDIL